MLLPSGRLKALCLCILTLAACTESTAPNAALIQAQRARWTGQAVTSYTYIYRVTGFFINYQGQDITLTIHNDSVVSALISATGEPRSPTGFPTIDELFDQALAASRGGTLTHIEFDSKFGYPTRMDLAGPPDASGSVFSSSLQPAP
jgi:uncharacterized protein DUF6174